MEMDKKSFPEGWKSFKLGEVCERITKGGTPTTYGFAFVPEGINFIKVENIECGKVNLGSIRTFITQEAHSYQKKSQLQKDDLLFSIAGTIGETCLIREEYLPANTNQALAILRGYNEHLLPQFLTLQLNSTIAQIVKSKARGGAMNNISLEDLKQIDLVVPSKEEQQRIIAKIEELFSELDAGKQEAEKALEQLKVYRQAVLKWAFEGRLTNEHVEDGELPEGWEWKRSGNLFDFVTSGSRGWAKYYSDEGAIFVRITNLDFDSLDLDLAQEKIQFVNPPTGSEGIRTKVQEGDFLFSITGYLGMFAIAPKLDNAFVNQHIALCRPKSDFNKRFVGYWIISKSGGYHRLNQLRKGAVKAGLGLDDIKNFPVPLPAIEEQHRIVQEIEARLSVCDEIEKTLAQSLQQAEALGQSILKKAFEGKLT